MRHQSYPTITRQGRLKSILLALFFLLNLAAYSLAQTPEDPQQNPAYTGDPAAPATATVLPPNIVFALLVGAGLLVAGKRRSHERESQRYMPAADFEMALRVQNMPRVRVDQTPLYRDRSVCLYRIASHLGCDQ